MHIITKIAPRYAHLETFAASMPQIFEHEGEVIYRGRNLIKTMTAPDGTLVNVKRYHQPSGPNRLIYSWGLRKSKGSRAFRYPAILAAKDIGTPDAIALVEERNSLGLLCYSYLLTVQSPYPYTLYAMGDAKEGEYEALAEALGRFAAHLHEQEVLHKDFTPGNILWSHDADGYHFALVDINRMAFGPVSSKTGLATLCRLWGPKAFVRLTAESYAQARDYDVATAVQYVMERRARFWRRYGKKHTIKFKLEL